MKRREDWPEQLAASVSAALGRPFKWGAHDCGLFAADCVLAMTGHDCAADLRGAYDDPRSALAVIERLGGLAAIATQAFGYPIPVPMASRGDVLLLRDLQGRELLGVCVGTEAAAPGPERLNFVPVSHAVAAWRVG